MLKYSKSQFETITKCSTTTEKCLMIYVIAVRDAYSCHETSNVGFIRSENKPAGGLSNAGKRNAL